MIKKYVAKYEYHQPRLAEIEVEKETEKTVTRTGDVKDILHSVYYLPTRLTRTDYNIFDTKKDALNWLIAQAHNDVTDMQVIIEKVNSKIISLLEMRDKV